MNIPNKRELQQIAINHLLNIDFKDFMKHKKCTAEPYPSLVKDLTSPSTNPLHFRQNLLERIYNSHGD